MQLFTHRFMTACVFSSLVASGSAMANEHPTIRAMSGAEQIKQLPNNKTALLVIDFQNEYFTGKMPIPDGAAALAKTQELIRFADSNKMPVYYVQHVAPAGSAVFAIDGETVKLHKDMQPRAKDVVLQKSTVSVFGSTDLNDQLKKAGIDTVIISGLMTHACVAGAARDAAPLGYNVLVASDASATRTITRFNGQTVDKDSLHKSALAEVEDTFGDVMTTEQIIKLPIR
ncbi:cysteine hydrolase family protein [Pseudomonas sp. SED1]|uniref:cysteine hydrolase family protein n=1 Tax=Pseudomonas sp. SED1 TaxID=3056845 RepID=UPI00296FBF8C|nr:isochorismatase family protein [Pseudomonas sp. SED1]MDY0836540.1 isochorismatase family protein [Pseudomonas sp. SED1]